MDKDFQSRFCILPWVQLCTSTDGTILSCCRSRGTKNLGSLAESSISKIWNSKKYLELRSEIAENNKVYDCEDCYHLESIGVKSVRQYANEEYHQYIPLAQKNNPTIKSLELRLSNICNFKCKTCGPRFSSSWIPFADDKNKYSITSAFGKRNSFWNELDEILPQVELIYFAGGEPLLHADHYKILEMLIANQQTDCKISYNTNLSMLNFDHYNTIETWKKFKQIKLNVSLDGTNEKGEYIRTGLNWELFKNNILTIRNELPTADIELSFTLSILNLFHLPDFLMNVLKEKIVDSVAKIQMNFLEQPVFYHVGILNLSERNEIVELFKLKHDAFSKMHDNAELGFFKSKLDEALNYLKVSDYQDERKNFSMATRKVDIQMEGKFLTNFPELKLIYLDGFNQILN